MTRTGITPNRRVLTHSGGPRKLASHPGCSATLGVKNSSGLRCGTLWFTRDLWPRLGGDSWASARVSVSGAFIRRQFSRSIHQNWEKQKTEDTTGKSRISQAAAKCAKGAGRRRPCRGPLGTLKTKHSHSRLVRLVPEHPSGDAG